MSIVHEAKLLANQWHAVQVRKHSGLPYIVHPARVASHVQGLGGDDEMIAAAWLHDVLEDTACSALLIEDRCGAVVRFYVESWLTNPSKTWSSLSRQDRKAMDRSHLAKAPDRVKIIKLCDRLDNLRDLEKADASFKLLYASETRALVRVLRDASPKLASQLIVECDRLTSDASVALATAA